MELIWPMVAVLVFILGDILSGIAQAVANKDLCSSKMRSGIWHKAGYVGVVALCFAVDWASGFMDLGFTTAITAPACVLIVLTECVSIAENLCKLNPEMQDGLVGRFLRGIGDAALPSGEKKSEEKKDDSR